MLEVFNAYWNGATGDGGFKATPLPTIQVAQEVAGTPCTKAEILDRSCEMQSAWAAVDAATQAASAAMSTVHLSIAGLFVGSLTLMAAFYAAWQAKRGADAAVHDARANAAAAQALADDRNRQLSALARMHGGKLIFPDCSIQFQSSTQAAIRLLMENIGETTAVIEAIEFALVGSIEDQKHTIVQRQPLESTDSCSVLPSEQRQFIFAASFPANEDIVGANSWFATNLYIWLIWKDSFDFVVTEEWLAKGTNVVGTIANTSTMRQISQVRAPVV